MNTNEHPHLSSLDTEYGAAKGTLLGYLVGFALSVALTLLPYFLIVDRAVTKKSALVLVTAFAVLQLVVQLVFFLHLSNRSRARWNLTAFAFTIVVVAILVAGSLWIMNNLNYNMMPQMIEKNSSVLSAY